MLGKAVIRITDVGAVVLGTDVLGADEQEQKCLAQVKQILYELKLIKMRLEMILMWVSSIILI